MQMFRMIVAVTSAFQVGSEAEREGSFSNLASEMCTDDGCSIEGNLCIGIPIPEDSKLLLDRKNITNGCSTTSESSAKSSCVCVGMNILTRPEYPLKWLRIHILISRYTHGKISLTKEKSSRERFR